MSSLRSRLRRAGHRADDGYALVIVTVISLVLSGILIASIVPVVVNSRVTGDVQRRTEGRLLAESVLNELYTAVSQTARPITDTFPPLAGRHAPGKRVSDAGSTAGWAMFDPAAATYVACADLRQPCFSYGLRQEAPSTNWPGQVIVAEVTARVGCRTTPSTCTYTKLQQRWRRRAFLDYLMFTVRETLDPSLYPTGSPVNPSVNCDIDNPTTRRGNGCREVAYIGYSAPTTAANELWVGEAWLRSGGSAWTLSGLFTDGLPTPPSNGTMLDRLRAGTSSATVSTVSAGALRMATKVKPPANGSRQVQVVADEATRVRWRVGDVGTWTETDVAGGSTWTSTTLSLGPLASLSLEIVAVNENPLTYPQIRLSAAGPGAFSELSQANLTALAVNAATRDLAVGVDDLRGPIHTNDPWFWNCGTPNFTALVEATGDPSGDTPGTEDTFKSADPSCTGTPVAPTTAVGLNLQLPTSTSQFASIAGASWTQTGPATLVFNDNQVSINGGSPVFLPRGGVIHVNGNASVRGTADEVTVSATGSITLDGDLTDTDTDAASPSTAKDIDIGIVAGQGIVIVPSPTVRTVEAALVALNGTIAVSGWETTRPQLTAVPELRFVGAMAAKFRPVFATFDTSGGVLTGIAKNFAYPDVPPNPPWLLGPVRSQWDRVELVELPALTDGVGLAVDVTRTSPIVGCTAGTSADLPYLATCLKP